MEQRNQTLDVLRVVQYCFPMVFVILAFGFYFNDRVPALMAWIFAAVGFIEYCLLGILRFNLKAVKEKKLAEAALAEQAPSAA